MATHAGVCIVRRCRGETRVDVATFGLFSAG